MRAVRDRLRDRLRKLSLLGGARSEDASGAGHDEPLKGRRPQREITKASAGDLLSLYDLGGHVMASAHPGMEVLFGRRRCDDQQVVIKTREKSAFKGAWEVREWRKTTVAQLNMPYHEGVCEYFAVYETREKYFVVMERVKGMDLYEHVQQGHVDQECARHILFQMLGALKAMHASGRIHKDLKLENVMVDLSSQESPTKVCGASSSISTGRRLCRVDSDCSRTTVVAKLIDFDTVEDWAPKRRKAKAVVGTPEYIAPEAYSGDYSPASDVYSVGVLMYRLLTGRMPFRPEIFACQPGENWVGSPSMRRVRGSLVVATVDFERPPLHKLPDAQDLVRRMMAPDARERPSAAGALDHPWFGGGDGCVRPSCVHVASRPTSTPTSAGSSRAASDGSTTWSAASSASTTPAPATLPGAPA